MNAKSTRVPIRSSKNQKTFSRNLPTYNSIKARTLYVEVTHNVGENLPHKVPTPLARINSFFFRFHIEHFIKTSRHSLQKLCRTFHYPLQMIVSTFNNHLMTVMTRNYQRRGRFFKLNSRKRDKNDSFKKLPSFWRVTEINAFIINHPPAINSYHRPNQSDVNENPQIQLLLQYHTFVFSFVRVIQDLRSLTTKKKKFTNKSLFLTFFSF